MKPILLIATLFFAFACAPESKEKTGGEIPGKFDSLHIDAIPVSKQAKSRFMQHDSFPSRDSLLIFADIYERKDSKPTILLCHQAGFSRGEYREIAFRIGSIGFSSIAIDFSIKSFDTLTDITAFSFIVTEKTAMPEVNFELNFVFSFFKSAIEPRATSSFINAMLFKCV